jgi:hypothetical protein
MNKKQNPNSKKIGLSSNELDRKVTKALGEFKGAVAKGIAPLIGQSEHQLWQQKMTMKAIRAGKIPGTHFDTEVPVEPQKGKGSCRLDFADFQTDTIIDRKSMKPNQTVKSLVKGYQDQRIKHCQGYSNYTNRAAAQYIYSIYPSAVSGQITKVRSVSIRMNSQGRENVSAYDDKGRVIERFKMDRSGKVTGHAKIDHYSRGKLVTKLSANGKQTGYIMTRNFKNGSKIISRYDANKKPLGHVVIRNNSNGTKSVMKFDAQRKLTQRFAAVARMISSRLMRMVQPPPKPGSSKSAATKPTIAAPPKPGQSRSGPSPVAEPLKGASHTSPNKLFTRINQSIPDSFKD